MLDIKVELGEKMAKREDYDEPVYIISIAAKLASMHPQTLRFYDRFGLVCPRRSKGQARRYSARDIDNLRNIQELSRKYGLNIEGVKLFSEMETRITQFKKEFEKMENEMERRRKEMEAEIERIHRSYSRGLIKIPTL